MGTALGKTGSFGWDVASGDVFWSAQSFSIFEYEKGIKPSIDLMIQRVHPEDLSRVRRAFERASKEAVDFDIEYRLLIPGDTIKHIHAVARAMLQEPAKRQFVGALMDVTAAKRAEEQLHEAQAKLAYVGRVTSLGGFPHRSLMRSVSPLQRSSPVGLPVSAGSIAAT